MKIGMTGSRNGISNAAINTLTSLPFFNIDDVNQVHHGDCIGADTTFHNIVEKMNIEIVIHPPLDNKLRSYCKSINILKPKPYLQRNHNIVDASDILIAFPPSKEEVLRSGTWSTIRYARKNKKTIYIIFPDGSIQS